MSQTAGAEGAALPVSAQTGPPVGGVQAVALALLEVAATDEALARMHDKAAKVDRQVQELHEAAEEGVNAAQYAAEEAMSRAAGLLGTDDDGQVLDLARRLAAEHARHEQELAALTARVQGGGE